MTVTLDQIQKKFPDLFVECLGTSNPELEQISPLAFAQVDSMVFVSDNNFVDEALACPAMVLVLGHKMKAKVEGSPVIEGRSVLLSRNVKLAMALVKQEFFFFETPLQKIGTIHSTAVIDPTAQIDPSVTIGAYSVIGQNVTVAAGVRIDASVVIEADCKVGKDSHLQSHLYVGPGTEIGERCELQPNSTIGAEGFGFAPDEKGRFHRIRQTGKVILHNDVEIGANSTIDRATFGVTRIGAGTKIDKLSHVAHNCEIGENCIMAGKFAVAGSTKIGNHFIAGGRVTVKDGIEITHGVEIAGLSGVHQSITAPGQYGGYPLQPLRDALRSGMSLVHLPQLRRSVAKIMKHLGINEDEC